jgi:hypothetical protein
MGDLHFSQGDGEITFCGAIEMAGWLHIKVDVIKDGVSKYGIKNPVFKPSPMTPNYKDYLIFEGISVDEAGKQHYLDVHIASAACLDRDFKVRLFRRAGLFHPGHRARPHLRRSRPMPARRCGADKSSTSTSCRRRWPIKHQGRHPDAAVAT